MGVIFAFFAMFFFRENYPHAKIKPICLYEGNSSIIVKITPTWNVLQTFSRNFPPAKITTFTVLYILHSVKWEFVVVLPDKHPSQRPYLTAVASSAKQHLIIHHDPESLNIPVWFSVNVGTPLTTSIRQGLSRKANIWKERMLKYLQ